MQDIMTWWHDFYWSNHTLLDLAGLVALILIFIVVLLVMIAFILLFDRKVWAAVQMRRGPNVVGPYGLLQSFADLFKFVFKEFVMPAAALDRPAGPIGLSQHAGAKGLPQGHHPFELGERRIGAGQHEVFGPGLGRQQTIKRISVRYGPQAGLSSSSSAPALQFVVGQGLEERLIHPSLQEAELPARAGIQGHQLGDGFAMARQHDALAGGDPGQQGRKMGLRFLNIDATGRGQARRARQGGTLNDGHNLVWSVWSDQRSRACDWAGPRPVHGSRLDRWRQSADRRTV
jgi:hypothetical protein